MPVFNGLRPLVRIERKSQNSGWTRHKHSGGWDALSRVERSETEMGHSARKEIEVKRDRLCTGIPQTFSLGTKVDSECYLSSPSLPLTRDEHLQEMSNTKTIP
jgi:hypothetical protein